MKVLITAGLGDYKLETKLKPILGISKDCQIFLIRKKQFKYSSKIICIYPKYKIFRVKFIFEIWRLFTLIYVAVTKKVDVIIGIQLVLHGVQAASVGALLRKPVVLSVIGDDVHKYAVGKISRFILFPFIRTAQHITVMGEKSAAIIAGFGIDDSKISIVQNAHNTEKFYPTADRKRWDLIFIGDLIARKRIPDLLRALAGLKEDYSLVILGDGSQFNYLEQLTIRLGLQEQVSFLGNKADVASYLNKARALVLPSELEALPAVAVEAMLCRVPQILTEICDVPTFFRDKEGCRLYDVGNIEKLREMILWLLENDDNYNNMLHLTECWSQNYQQRWSEQQLSLLWKELLCKVSNEN